jgi:hypothetical protein
MPRITGADPRAQSLLAGLWTRLVYWLVRRRLGRVPSATTVAAHHPGVLWGSLNMTVVLDGERRVPAALKTLAQVRTATLIGCPF